MTEHSASQPFKERFLYGFQITAADRNDFAVDGNSMAFIQFPDISNVQGEALMAAYKYILGNWSDSSFNLPVW